MDLQTLQDLPEDARRLLVELVAWQGDWETPELAGEAGLDAQDVSRRLLPWLRAQGLVEPAAYRVRPGVTVCSMGGLACELFDALSNVGPTTRAQLCEAATTAMRGADPAATPVSPTSGSTKRELAALVAGGMVLPPGAPVPTPRGVLLVRLDDEARAYCDQINEQVARWRAKVRRAC